MRIWYEAEFRWDRTLSVGQFFIQTVPLTPPIDARTSCRSSLGHRAVSVRCWRNCMYVSVITCRFGENVVKAKPGTPECFLS